MKHKRDNQGFTFVEVLVAMLIFVVAVVAAIELIRGAVRATVKTREITIANWLLQNTMTELETKLDTLGFEQGCEKKSEAKFAEPYGDYQWRTYCTQIDFELAEMASSLTQAVAGEDDGEALQEEDPIMQQLLALAGSYMSESSRELHAEVLWDSNGTERSISATTHVVNLDSPFQLPNFGGGSTNPDDGAPPADDGGTTELPPEVDDE